MAKKLGFDVGDIVRVHSIIREGERTRNQIFEGRVIAISGRGKDKTFTVRKIASANVGVERIWPVLSPLITKVEVVKKTPVKRAKLYYLRKLVGTRATKL